MSRTARAFLVLLVLAGWVPRASAEILPSFHLQSSTWRATHVIVVTEGKEIDGIVEVLESWKGDRKKGDQLVLPLLAAFAPQNAREISYGFGRKRGAGDPSHVTGSRMVLFLWKKGEEWTPAGWGEMKVSMAWIERGKAYAFVQEMNPGPCLLVPLNHWFPDEKWVHLSEEKMKALVAELVKVHAAIERGRTLPAVTERVEALAPLLRPHQHFEASDAVLAALVDCGEPALPAFRRMIQDEGLSPLHCDIVRARARLPGAGAELTLLIKQELVFWKKTAPTLKPEWEQDTRLRDRYDRLCTALHALGRLRFPDGEGPVRELRDFVARQPRFEDRNGLEPLLPLCERVLQGLNR